MSQYYGVKEADYLINQKASFSSLLKSTDFEETMGIDQ